LKVYVMLRNEIYNYMTKERVLIIADKNINQDDYGFQSSLDEIISLSKTAGSNVIKVMTQRRQHIHPAFYLGEGKIVEIKRAVDDLNIDVVISNDELSAGQLRNLDERLGVRIIDRSQLILDIFAQRSEERRVGQEW